MDFRKFLALSLCFLFIFPDLSHSNIQLPGWLGDNKMPGSVLKLKKGVSSATFDPSRVTQLSWRPRAFLYKGFLSDEECDHLINLARDKMEKSMVADNESGKSIMSEVRTSSGMFLWKYQDEVVADIEARIAAWTFLPIENGEAMQVLHYLHGEKYEPHFDYFHDKENQKLGGHRVATVLMYLSNVEKGGETVFPNSESKVSQPKDDDVSDCAKNGYAVKPKKGDALLFFSLNPDATRDTHSLHGSCPVIEGEKWSATKWIRVRSFEKPVKQERMGGKGDCVDENENCPVWAKVGECKKNPLYMVGDDGKCRKSCKVCSSFVSKLKVGNVGGETLPSCSEKIWYKFLVDTLLQKRMNNLKSACMDASYFRDANEANMVAGLGDKLPLLESFCPENPVITVCQTSLRNNTDAWKTLNLSRNFYLPPLNDEALRKAVYGCESESPNVTQGTNYTFRFQFGESEYARSQNDTELLEVVFPFPTLLPSFQDDLQMPELLPFQKNSTLASRVLCKLQNVEPRSTPFPVVIMQECLTVYIKKQVDYIGKHILSKLMTDWRLMDELAVLRAIYLLGSGDLLQHFLTVIFNKLDKGETWDDDFELNTLLQARRSFRALKGLVRLQGVVRGQNVKRQTVNAMRYMQLLVQVQSQIQSRRIQMFENQARHQAQFRNDKEVDSTFGKWSQAISFP